MKILPIETGHDARRIAEEIYLISKPNPSEYQVTRRFNNSITHPETGQKALVFPEEATMYVDSDADSDRFYALVEQWESETAAKEAKKFIEDNRGSTVTVINLLPQETQDSLLTEDEADTNGWFATDDST